MTTEVRNWGDRLTIGRELLLALFTLAFILSIPATAHAKLSLQPVSVTENSLSVAVDPRIELVSIVQYLSDYAKSDPSLVSRLDHSYRKDVDDWFGKFKSHPVIEMLNRMSSKGFCYDAPPHAVLYLNADLTLNAVIFKDDQQGVTRAGGKEQMIAFARALRAFAVESDFAEFYKKHDPFYRQITQNTIKRCGDRDVIKQLEQYFGEKRSRYTIVLSPMLGRHNYGPQVERKKGEKEVYCIMGAWKENAGIPEFGSPDFFHQLQWHEFGHSFVNPLVLKYSDLWEKHSNLFSPMESKMKKLAYDQWFSVVIESTLRAVTTRLDYRFSGKDAGDKDLQREIQEGFVFTEALTKKLEEYEANRTKYPTLEAFMPELFKALDGFSESSVRDALDAADLTVDEVLSDVLSKDSGILVYEVPDVEGRDDAVTYAEAAHDKYFSKLKMMDARGLDETAFKGELKSSFVLYTTIGSRLFRAATEPLNIRIDGGTLHWNGVSAPISELRVIAVGKNPYGSGNCLVFAGGSNKLLVDITRCCSGLSSYRIFRDMQLLKEGLYNNKFVIKDGQQ